MDSKQYFDDVAQRWDSMRKNFFPESVRERALDVAQVRPGQKAADVGAGSGFMTEGLVARGLNVIAVDQSEAMQATMRAKFTGRGEIEYRLGEAEQLPLPDQAVDYVFANMCLHHVETPASGVREMARTLKPGGKLVITDLDLHQFEFLRTEMHDRWLGFRREDVQAWFTDAGLKDVAVDSAGDNCTAASNSGVDQATVSIFVASGTRPIQ